MLAKRLDRCQEHLGEGLTYAFRDRRNKKRNFRALWIQRINAAARLEGLELFSTHGWTPQGRYRDQP